MRQQCTLNKSNKSHKIYTFIQKVLLCHHFQLLIKNFILNCTKVLFKTGNSQKAGLRTICLNNSLQINQISISPQIKKKTICEELHHLSGTFKNFFSQENRFIHLSLVSSTFSPYFKTNHRAFRTFQTEYLCHSTGCVPSAHLVYPPAAVSNYQKGTWLHSSEQFWSLKKKSHIYKP